MNKIKHTSRTVTDFWNDSCDIRELDDAIRHGAVGATSNPVIVGTVVKNSPEVWGKELERTIRENPTATEDEIAWTLIGTVCANAAKLLLPVFENSTKGTKGRLAVQVNPKYYRNSDRMIEQAKHLATIAPNMTIKLPATMAGIVAMEELTAMGITVTATVCFSVPQAVACAEAMQRGITRYGKEIQPYIAIMVGRLDDQLKRVMATEGTVIDPGYLEWAGIAVFKKAYQIFTDRKYSAKLLAAAYRNHMQWSEFIGGDVVVSIPYKWWKRFGSSDVDVTDRMDNPVCRKIIDELYEKFADFRKAYDVDGMNCDEFASFGASIHTLNQFISAYDSLLTIVREGIFHTR